MRELQLAAIFTDHMVLQMGKTVSVWGQGRDNTKVTVDVAGVRASSVVSEDTFMIKLPPMPYGGPYEMKVSDGKTTLTFCDVYVGEVFLAGGQSNMEMALCNCAGGAWEAETAECNELRMYNVLKAPVMDEENLVLERERQWKVCHPGAFEDVSAVAYFCAKRIQEKLKVAVGVIDCYQGGTSITCWTSRESLNQLTFGKQFVAEYDKLANAKTEEQYDREFARFTSDMDQWNADVAALREEDPDISGEEITRRLGDCPWNPPIGRKSVFRPCGLYETMLSRVIPYTVRGVWYYQGEEDTTSRAEEYETLLKNMIALWRQDYHDLHLPFIIVQLPMYIEKGAEDDKSWAIVRKAQYDTCNTMRNTGMVCLLDCGEFDNIHPLDKKTVGKRLADKTLEDFFQQDIVGTSLYADHLEKQDNALLVSFQKQEELVSDVQQIPYFEIAGEDGIYYEATAAIEKKYTIRVSSEKVDNPRFVRYGWVNYGKVTLFSKMGLPIAPFVLEY